MNIRAQAQITADCKPYHRLGAYRAWQLDEAVGAPIDMVWMCSGNSHETYRHRVLPLGEPSLAIRRKRDGAGQITDAEIVICGPYSRPSWHYTHANTEMIAVRLKPEFAGEVLGLAPAEFTDQPPAAATGHFCRRLINTNAALETDDRHKLVKALIDDIRRMAAERTLDCQPEHFAAACLRKTAGNVAIRKIASSLSISERHLRRRFQNAIGCPPKEYGKRLRVAEAAITADRKTAPNWAAIAVETGFHDQAHMIRAFKALSGLTPRALHRERRGDG